MKKNLIVIALFLLSTIARAQDAPRLPTGLLLSPAGNSFDVGNMPLAVIASPKRDRLILSLNGWRERAIQVLDPAGKVLQTLPQTGAFLGLAFSKDGKSLYASGGNEDTIYHYRWKDGTATFLDKIVLENRKAEEDSKRYPAGIAADKKFLYVAENLSDTVAVIDLKHGAVLSRYPVDHFPYGVVVGKHDYVYITSWGASTICRFKTDSKGKLLGPERLTVGRDPSAILQNHDGSRLFVASASTNRIFVVDTNSFRVIATLKDSPPAGPDQGSTPNALALSDDKKRLYVAEADNNAVAVFSLSRNTADVSSASGNDELIGRIPVGWYPTALYCDRNHLYVVNGKGHGAGPNPEASQPTVRPKNSTGYTLGQLNGTVTVIPANLASDQMESNTKQVWNLNGWDVSKPASSYPPFEHVLYIIKENRTYDQVLADLPDGDGDPSLLFFPRDISPNHHALAERFGLFDRFFVNAEVSAQGHQWSTAAYVTDYTEKTAPLVYADQRPELDEQDEVDSALGYIWGLAAQKGLQLRDYGEYAGLSADGKTYEARQKSLGPFVDPNYPSFDMDIPDQVRADEWIVELNKYAEQGNFPALEIMHLPMDHTAGLRAGKKTPKACMADNDLALGRIVEALSKSPFWGNTVVFVLEDDAQDGPDHVDSHRSVLLVISAYNRPGTIHRFVNTTDVLASIESILGLGALSQFDFYGRPLADVFGTEPDLTPYTALPSTQKLDELNVQSPTADRSLDLDLQQEDRSDDTLFNEILWAAMKGENTPYPGSKHISLLDLHREK